MVRKIGKTGKYLYEGGCIGDEIGELPELAAVVELEPWRAREKDKGQHQILVCLVSVGF